MKLSEKLSNYRTDRPSEWTMDEFNRDALELEKQLQQYKSIVKTVDADNLPDDNVLGFDSSGKSIIGKIWIDSFGVTICGFGGNTLSNITHYIEKKDLIEFIALGEEK